MTRRNHTMPFGARVLENGQVCFHLWAPAARQVDLCLFDNEPAIIPLVALDEGWFELISDRAHVGSRYQFRIDGDLHVPDPASRFQPEDIHGPSQVIDPRGYVWRDDAWNGRPWHEAVIYELHVGSFTGAGSFVGATERLDQLADLGITAVELMPVADFPGRRDWGYNGVLPFAPDSIYGTPDQLKAFIDSAHARGLMVFLDVVYNHFGPEGNYLHHYAPSFFTERHHTPWGAAINFDGDDSHWVRQFFIHNALYWLEEFHLDGLRLDAVHAIIDDGKPDILSEVAQQVDDYFGEARHIHLVLENDYNAARYLQGKKAHYAAQWNDDIHHAFHVLLTGETGGYYMDYAEAPLQHLGRCLSEGFAYQGEVSSYRDGARRGEASSHLPATAFVSFLQNHDQTGNRAFGERIDVLCRREPLIAAQTILLLAPSPPLIFMGEEWGCLQPFPFFCDFGDDLADAVTEGRRREFARFPEFVDPQRLAAVPDPMAQATFLSAVLQWNKAKDANHVEILARYHRLLALRGREIIPRLAGIKGGQSRYSTTQPHLLKVTWSLGDGSLLTLIANLGDSPVAAAEAKRAYLLESTHGVSGEALPPWSVYWYLEPGGA